VAALGVAAALGSLLLEPTDARSAAGQVWSPFVLVTGLLLVGLVADRDGLFAAAGYRLASAASGPLMLYAGAAVLVVVVTALLNLDTSVVFLTPVLVHAARSRGRDERPLVIACVLLSNAGSLLLPGSNLTNLIVLGHLRLSGAGFLAHMALPWVVAAVVTGAVVAVAERRTLRHGSAAQRSGPAAPSASSLGLGAAAIVAVAVLILALPSPALPVAAIGVATVAIRLHAHRLEGSRVRSILGAPVLVGLFGIAMALGTLGRAWSGPATLLAHLDTVETALCSAGVSVLVNNLPAASILAARVPPHPFALLVGLDIGPNLFVTGSLAWVLWLRTARAAGSTPPLRRAIGLGLITAPLAMAGALGALAVTGVH
jgi:arsenical pump membrane protein